MSMEAHLVELKKRHRALEQEIEQVAARPSTDTLDVVRLKRKKLLLKEEIQRLSQKDAFH